MTFLIIKKTYLYNFDPLEPHFCIVKLGFTGVYIIFLISAQNIDCGYSLEPPRRGGSNEYHNLCFEQKYGKYLSFLSENFQFLEMEFSIYLNRCVFVMISNCVRDKIPDNVQFQIPPITSSQVSTFIRRFDLTKATGLDKVGPRILKLACDVISPSIAFLINKSIQTSQFSQQLKMAEVFPIFKSGQKTDHQIITPFRSYQLYLIGLTGP